MATERERMPVEFERVDNAVIVTFATHEISPLDDIEALSDALKKEVNRNRPAHLILDFTGVDFIGTSTISMLVVLLKRLRTNNGDLHLCGMSRDVKQIFELTEMTRIFNIHRDRKEALAACT